MAKPSLTSLGGMPCPIPDSHLLRMQPCGIRANPYPRTKRTGVDRI
jgi:hypothetical protein